MQCYWLTIITSTVIEIFLSQSENWKKRQPETEDLAKTLKGIKGRGDIGRKMRQTRRLNVIERWNH